ncbi:RagB/SusD family nutrient uptake outer membrane protein [Flavobacteriaceae bacterium]|nr:RagB/SusD family nutrient uptake outer membrane protein [Flavobacteriaceae bacterium]
MKKTINNVTALLIAIMAVVACTDDFINVPSKNQNSEDFFNTKEDYESALIGAYDLLQSTYLNVLLGEIASDNTLCGGENANDVPGFQQVDDMIHTSSNLQLRALWSRMYAGVNRTNYILEFQDKTSFSDKDNIIGQVKFLRAYYYFELVKWFGDVPMVIDKRIQFGDQFNVGRTPKAEVYSQIQADLVDAASKLPITQPTDGKVTRGAALSLLGKVYLFQEKFDEAAAELEKVIESNTYSLVSNFGSIFEHEGENNSESVFEIQYTDTEGASFDCLQCSSGNVAVGFSGIRSYDGPLFDSGFSFNVPTQDLVDAFENGDQRKDVTILDIVAWAKTNGAKYAEGYEHTGYFNRKYLPRKGDKNMGDANLTNPNNYRSIRYADVLLMAAEAYSKKSSPNESKAQNYLNQVRERAGLLPVTIGGSVLTESIMKERRVELAGEGHRFFDLVRTGEAENHIDGFVSNKHELFPIPLIEIELAGGRWEQNPGY